MDQEYFFWTILFFLLLIKTPKCRNSAPTKFRTDKNFPSLDKACQPRLCSEKSRLFLGTKRHIKTFHCTIVRRVHLNPRWVRKNKTSDKGSKQKPFCRWMRMRTRMRRGGACKKHAKAVSLHTFVSTHSYKRDKKKWNEWSVRSFLHYRFQFPFKFTRHSGWYSPSFPPRVLTLNSREIAFDSPCQHLCPSANKTRQGSCPLFLLSSFLHSFIPLAVIIFLGWISSSVAVQMAALRRFTTSRM